LFSCETFSLSILHEGKSLLQGFTTCDNRADGEERGGKRERGVVLTIPKEGHVMTIHIT
jgi:hypothetical protein